VTAAVEIRDLFRVYTEDGAGVPALQGLTLTVRAREICVVLGPSGSGKTTLLRILAGLDKPSAGTVRVLGTDLGRLRGRRLAGYRARDLGYAEQHYRRALAEELTARELVGLHLALAGATARERNARADELLERVGLADRRHAHPHELSGGEQQRIAVCAALAHRPALLLADEPTGELDAENAASVYALIGELAREEGATTVIVSHDPRSGVIADRIVRVRDGRVSEEAAKAGDEEAIVVGKGGWLRLSEELLRRAGIGAHAAAKLEGESIVVARVGKASPSPSEAEHLEPAPEHVPLPGEVPVAELRGVAKHYGTGHAARAVFAGVDATFLPGRLYAVTGPSGTGKTTLLHLLAGLELPDEGAVLVGGRPMSTLSRAERAAFRRDRIALVGQDPGLVSFLSGLENVELGLALRGLHAAPAAEALAEVGLRERAGGRVEHLSAGERERVAVARALASRPALLLADEPTARLDEANGRAVAALLAALARETGAAVVCATHDPLVVEQADEILPLARRDARPPAPADGRPAARIP